MFDTKAYQRTYYQQHRARILEHVKTRSRTAPKSYTPEEWRTYQNNWNKKHPDRRRIARERNFQTVLNHYGQCCACCGETTILFLTVDHINNDGAASRRQTKTKGGANEYALLVRLIRAETAPMDRQILCFNCNCGKARNKGICPHKQGT